MPLLYKKPFIRHELSSDLQDSDEVFYCDLTNEIFQDYEEFCERIILCNSLVWSCALTGKSNLTYQEALTSEESARKTLKEFPLHLRIPVLYLTSLTERKSVNELAEDVFCFARDRYFIGENVEVATADDTWSTCQIIKVLAPTQKELEKCKVPTKNGERHFWPPASLYKYCVEPLDESIEQEIIVGAHQLHRKKGSYSRDKNRLYIKQFIEQKNGMWKLKESTVNKSGISMVKFNQIFVGERPVLNPGKKAQMNELLRNSYSYLKKEKRQESLDKYFSKKSPNKEGSQSAKQISPKKPSATPQKLMAKKLKEKYKTVHNMKNSKLMKKIQDKHILKKKNIRKSPTRMSEAELMELKKNQKEQKQKLLAEKRAKVKAKKEELANFMKEWHRQREDLELEDLKDMPTPIPLELRIPNECFGDFVMVMEFLHTFGQFIHIKDYFPGGFTFDILERALVDKEINGPLRDILEMLLGSIFTLQEEEEDEIKINESDLGQDLSDDRRDFSTSEAIRYATSAAAWTQLHHGTPLNKIVIDAGTLTEVLRLHILASGGRCTETSAKWRYQQRGGYTSSDDPGLMLRIEEPHILQALSQSNVCDISIRDKLKILNCLTNQILTFSNLRDEIEERSEKVKQGRTELRSLHAADSKRDKELLIKSKAGAITPQQLSQERLQLEKLKETRKRKAEELNELNLFTQVMPLGLDRAYRRFWLFPSLPGIFIEQDNQFSGSCLPKPTPANQSVRFEDSMAYVRRLFEEGSNKENLAGDKIIKTPGTPNKKFLSEKNGDCDGTVINKAPDTSRSLTCWADPVNCPVHGPNKVSWSFFKDESDFNRLIESLNERGIREHSLRTILLQEKNRILQSLAKCPASKLNSSIQQPEVEEPRKTPRNNNSKYENANLNFPEGTPVDEILEATLRNYIQEIEQKVTEGCLGTLKVYDREAWIEAILNNSYDKQCDELIWGIKNRNPVISSIEDDEKSEENGSRPSTPSSEHSFKDPLGFMGNEVAQSNVIRDLASAILQIEQGVELRFLKRPLGLDDKERNKENSKKDDPSRVRERWETSLMSCTNFSQLFLHLATLENSISWEKSILKAFCRICRRRGDPENMLLCDKCNKGHHMYCLKPPLKKVPDGDWFCVRCKPREKVTTKKTKHVIEEDEEEIEEVKEVNDKKIREKELPVGKCSTCSKKGNILVCDACNKGQHLECIYPPIRRLTSKKWFCHKCRQPNPSTPDETSPTEAERSSRRRCSKAATAKISLFAKQLRSNSWDGNSDDKDKNESRRRSRRSIETDVGLSSCVAKDLPLDNATLQEMLEVLMHHKDAWPFLRPVTRAEVPDYHNIIKHPMDFGTVKHKLNMLEYRNNSEVIADAMLVFDNCFAYNQNDTDIFQCGVRLLKAFEKLCKERNLSTNSEELKMPETKRSRTVF